jgi:integrase
MITITSPSSAVQSPFDDAGFDEAQLAAASFLARYRGRTLGAYRHDLRGFFQWAADHEVPVLAATRPHIELWRGSMEQRGLAASTIDRRLSTVCGFYRFAHIDGRIRANPAEYVRRPQVHPSDARGLDRWSSRSQQPRSSRSVTALLTAAAELRHACRRAGHALHEPVHANDLWIAASAVHIGAPLLTADAVFDDVPGLSLHR